jgi:hypothetical protein
MARPAAWWAALLGLSLLLLLPLAVTQFPPVLDYPNHLARLFILARAGTDPVLDGMWQPHWAIIPDLGIDLIGPPLVRLLGPYPAGKVLLGLALLAPLWGAVAYSRAAFGERLYWPMTAALTAYGIVFALGFMNYLLALGLALAAAGLWRRLRGHAWALRAVAGAGCAVALFFVHLFGVLFFLLLVGAAERAAAAVRRRQGASVRQAFAAPAGLLAISSGGPLLLWWLAPRGAHPAAYDWSPGAKLFYLAGPFLAYRGWPGLFAAAAFAAVAGGWLVRRQARLAPGIGLSLVVLLGGFVAAPFALGGGTFVDARMPLMIALALSSGLRPPPAAGISGKAAGAVLVVAFLVSWTAVLRVWAAPAPEVAALRAAIAPIPAGARVMVAMPPVDPAAAYWRAASPRLLAFGLLRLDYNLPALLVTERRAFFPFLFSDPSQHPVWATPAYAALSAPYGAPPDPAVLRGTRAPDPHWPVPFLDDWAARFDYLLVIDAGAVPDLPDLLPARLALLSCSRFAALFRVRRPAPAAPDAAPSPRPACA